MMQEMAIRENYFMKKTVASSLEAECCLDPAVYTLGKSLELPRETGFRHFVFIFVFDLSTD